MRTYLLLGSWSLIQSINASGLRVWIYTVPGPVNLELAFNHTFLLNSAEDVPADQSLVGVRS